MGQIYEKTGSDGPPPPKIKHNYFRRNNKNRLQNLRNFLFSQNIIFFEVYESFSIACDVFFWKKWGVLAKTAVRLVYIVNNL